MAYTRDCSVTIEKWGNFKSSNTVRRTYEVVNTLVSYMVKNSLMYIELEEKLLSQKLPGP